MVAKITFAPGKSQKSDINKEFVEEFINILAHELIFTKFQPIVCLVTGDVVAYEALSRGPEGSIFENPVTLFEIADELNFIEDLDMLCRKKAISNAKKLALDTKATKLFINIDAASMVGTRHNKGETKSLIEEFGFEIKNIALEVTERAFIKNPGLFYSVLEHYQSQGFSIAIDDFGSGSAGIKLISETSPQIVKIDKFLTENIDKSTKKQGILKMIVEMCHKLFSSKVVAEGIETAEELITVKELGIDWGQGYLLGKPSTTLESIPAFVRNRITSHHSIAETNEENFSDETKVGDITSLNVPVVHSSATVGTLVKMFNKNRDLLGVPVVNVGVPVGLVMKTELFAKLGKQFGFDLFYRRPVSYVMNENFLTVDVNQSVDFVAKQVLLRDFSRLYDVFIVLKDGKYYGISTVHSLLERMTALKIKYASQSNPLTGLPGNISIKTFVEKQIKNGLDFACVYCDIDHFKSYNDYYGFCRGDEVIKRTACLITEVFKLSRIGYIGHIGGDDFIAVIHPEEIHELCTRFIKEFDDMASSLYADSDIKNGYIETLDRRNEKCRYPLMSISLAVVVSHENSRFHSFLEISNVTAEIKKKAKTIKGSIFLIDQRKD